MTRLHGAFLVFGALFGVWQVLLPDLTRELDISPGLLGGAISLGVLGSLPMMGVAGRLADRLGAGMVGGAAGLVLALGLAGFALASTQAAFVAVVVAFYIASGVYDVAINAAAMGTEQATGRRDLPILHAAFSAGGVLGAVTAGIGLAAAIDFRLLYPLTAGVAGVVIVAWAARQGSSTWSPTDGQPGVRSLYRDPLLLLLAGAAALAFLSEGAMESWSAIYLRDALGLSVLVGASGVALFHGAMTVGRLGTAAVMRAAGRHRTLMGGGAAVTAGMALVLLGGGAPPLVLAGIVIVGLGLSAVAPIAFSLAGDAAGARAGQASSVITTVGYAGFLFGPGLIGGIAEVTTLRTALVLVLIAGVAIAGAAMVMGRLPRA